MLLALPSSDGKLMDTHQTACLQTGFIDYLREKDAAGIINVPKRGGTEVSYLHLQYWLTAFNPFVCSHCVCCQCLQLISSTTKPKVNNWFYITV